VVDGGHPMRGGCVSGVVMGEGASVGVGMGDGARVVMQGAISHYILFEGPNIYFILLYIYKTHKKQSPSICCTCTASTVYNVDFSFGFNTVQQLALDWQLYHAQTLHFGNLKNLLGTARLTPQISQIFKHAQQLSWIVNRLIIDKND
jgi:hypothetical protein